MQMYETKVGKRYALALFELAQEQGVVEEVDAQLKIAGECFSSSDVIKFFEQPEISMKQKIEFIEKVFAGKVHPLIVYLLKLLLRKGRIRNFGEVCSYYDLLTDRLRGIEEVRVITAVPLEEEDYEMLLSKMKKYTDYPSLRLIRKVEPEILGGIIIELGREKIIDMSLKSQIYELRNQLIKHRAS